MNPEEARQRAERARQILEDELVKSSFAANIEELINKCAMSKDEKEAWRACSALKAAMDAQRSIATHIETAQIAEFNFRDERTKKFGLF